VNDRESADHSPLPFGPGDVVAGRYRLEEAIGAGGMSVVLAATHSLLGERVALKFVGSSSMRTAEATERLMREARIAAKLSSEHAVRVLDAGIASSGQLFVAMELLRGEDLRQRLANAGPLPLTKTLEVALGASDALAEAHGLGVVHRDIKPSNLYLARRARDGREVIKVLDFGVSKLGGPAAQAVDWTGTKVVGSPCYMAPEQLASSAHVDARADVWSLAAVLFECLAGHPPFRARTLGEYGIVLGSVQRPPSLRALRSDVPRALDQAFARALAMDPAKRTGSIEQLARELAEHLPRSHPLRSAWLAAPAAPRTAPADRLRDAGKTRMTPREALQRALAHLQRGRLALVVVAVAVTLGAAVYALR
jgi:serine/threonine-protein kinase